MLDASTFFESRMIADAYSILGAYASLGGHEPHNYCMQRTAGRLAEIMSQAALAGRR
jgi:hypothetical protein